MWILSIINTIFTVIAKIISYIPWWLWVCVAIFFFGGIVFHGGSCRDFMCSRTKEPKRVKWMELTVSSATTGASLTCDVGRRGRRSMKVCLSYIVAPSDMLAEESKASLERLSGEMVRIPYTGILKRIQDKPILFGAADDSMTCDTCDGLGVVRDICKINCFFCRGDNDCKWCNGTGKLSLSDSTVDICEDIVIRHLGDDWCGECKVGNGKPCKVLYDQLAEVVTNKNKYEIVQCFDCDGTGKLLRIYESQSIVGIVYSLYGQCLNTEQVRLGMATLAHDAPKEWKKFENEAKKNNLGVWKKR